jgi:D-3-phosphoglycerate dehydrogenase
MKVLLADRMDELVVDELRAVGLEVESRPDLTKTTLPQALDGVGILVVRATPVTAEAIEAGKQLNLIVRAGVSTQNIDVQAAAARGIYVASCPGMNAAAVAELVFGLLLSLDRRIVDATVDLRAGRWRRGHYQSARGLLGRRLGIVGLGAVGREVASRARAFGMEVTAWSRSLTPGRAAKLGVGYASRLDDLAAKSDVLSLHLPLTPSTRGIVSRAVLEKLPTGATVINTSRAGVLDYAALAALASERGLRAGLDVFPDEPDELEGAIDPALFAAGLVYATPHVAAATQQAQRAIAAETVRIVRAFLTEEDVPNVVNLCATSPARFALVLRMADRVGVLANTLNVLKRHGINIEEISNAVFDGARATCTKLRVSARPSEACLEEIRAFGEVLHVDVVALPNLA